MRDLDKEIEIKKNLYKEYEKSEMVDRYMGEKNKEVKE